MGHAHETHQPLAATQFVSFPLLRSSHSCWSVELISRPVTMKTTTPSTQLPATNQQRQMWWPLSWTLEHIWMPSMVKAKHLVNYFAASHYMKLSLSLNIAIYNVWLPKPFRNTTFHTKVTYPPSYQILLICIDN